MLKLSTFILRKDYCRQCLSCVAICPNQAILQREDNTLEIEASRCNNCGKCLEVCKLRAIKKTLQPHTYKPEA